MLKSRMCCGRLSSLSIAAAMLASAASYAITGRLRLQETDKTAALNNDGNVPNKGRTHSCLTFLTVAAHIPCRGSTHSLPRQHTFLAEAAHIPCQGSTHSLPRQHTFLAEAAHIPCQGSTHSLPRQHAVCAHRINWYNQRLLARIAQYKGIHATCHSACTCIHMYASKLLQPDSTVMRCDSMNLTQPCDALRQHEPDSTV
jgi:hypothetical protein